MNNVTREYWSKLTFDEQMGNIGSEVGRAIIAKRQAKPKRMDSAIDRALDLFYYAVDGLVGKDSKRLNEVLSAREKFLKLFFDDGFADADKVESYFMQFAIAARSGR